MAKEKVFNTKFIAGIGILSAIEVVLYIVGTVITNFAGVTINLGLIPIAIGAILFGPVGGAFLGVVNGVLVLLTPSTWTIFMDTEILGDWCIFGTILNCLTKTGLGGFIAGLVNKLFKKVEIAGSVVSSLLIPVVNTAVFICFAAIFYQVYFYSEGYIYGILSFNFLIEIIAMAVLCPAIVTVVKTTKRKSNSVQNFEEGQNEKD